MSSHTAHPSIPGRRHARHVDDEVEHMAHRVDEIELVLARFHRMNAPNFSGAEGGLVVEGWLEHKEANISSSAEHDVVTDDIIIDGPLRCSSWFPFDVPACPPSFFSACSWFLSFQLVHYAPAGSTWPPHDYEKLTQLWTSPLLIRLPFTMINQTNC
ncbi:separase [Dorcoceras hygrometricum]|uniref:Separase n=1 Tax=Dorcoceras hygrometricum TaxID=472368 RepID=A0A2Z7BL42_9LAMI|nr:separase [Dorcoceras hygrometricum]